MVCINKGCERYHGLKIRENHFFLSKQFTEGLIKGMNVDSVETASSMQQKLKEETKNMAIKW